MRVVEFEGYDGSEDVIQYFWDTLRELTMKSARAFCVCLGSKPLASTRVGL